MMSNDVLRTKLCEILGIEYPIMLAGMGDIGLGVAASGSELVAAVSNAGGLGVLGCATMPPDEIRDCIRQIRSLTDKPFGADVLLPSIAPPHGTIAELKAQLPPEHVAFVNRLRDKFGIPDIKVEADPHWVRMTAEAVKQQIRVVLEERVAVLAVGLGNPRDVVTDAYARGVKVVSLVGNTKNARRVAEAGVDIIVATGSEAGGHSSRVGLMSLIPQVVDAVYPTPVAAAGGITDGRQLVAALSLGACGVWCGTAFCASYEANIGSWWKELIIAADDESTHQTKYFTGKLNRHFRNPWDDAWEKSGMKPLVMPYQGLLCWDVLQSASQIGKHEFLGARAGQGSGLIKELKPAKQILDDMVAGAKRILDKGS